MNVKKFQLESEIQHEAEEKSNTLSNQEGIPVVAGRNNSYHSGIRAGHHTHTRKGRGQPRFYPVTKDEPTSGQFTQDMLRKVSYKITFKVTKITESIFADKLLIGNALKGFSPDDLIVIA